MWRSVKKHAKKVYDDPFQRYLYIVLFIFAVFLIFSGGDEQVVQKTDSDLEFHFFHHPSCPHCKAQKVFNEELMDRYPQVNFIYHDTSDPDQSELLRQYAVEYGLDVDRLGVPATFFGTYSNIGYGEVTGPKIESALQDYIENKEEALGPASLNAEPREISTTFTLPYFGEVDAVDFSLPMLAVVLGFVDGFNPCAMWVLVYLISLIMSIKDRKKIWLLVGTFVAASGILYFLFMTAWLNVFLIIGFLRPLTIIIGLGALGVGILNIKEFIETKGALTCEVGDVQSKRKTMNKMEQIVHAPLTWATMGSIVVLAFIVNSIEFACSAALPAIFTHVLAISNLGTWQYYGYILLYDFFFMLDDLVIFGLAAFAVNTSIGDQYAKYCKLIGGAVLLGLGAMLAFAPQLLA